MSDIFVPEPDPTPQAGYGTVDPWDDIQQTGARQIIGQRDIYAKAALGILQAWVGFLMVIILAQMTLRTLGTGLHDSEFITTITTTTASIIAFTFIVARYLFPEGGSRDGLRRNTD